MEEMDRPAMISDDLRVVHRSINTIISGLLSIPERVRMSVRTSVTTTEMSGTV